MSDIHPYVEFLKLIGERTDSLVQYCDCPKSISSAEDLCEECQDEFIVICDEIERKNEAA